MSLHSGAPERPRIIKEEDRPGPPPLMSEERGKGKNLTIVAAVLAVAAFAGVVWYAYDQGRRIGSETAAPLIKADTGPSKVRPDSPGGMQIPHQDKLVLDDLGSGRGTQNGESRVERLLPPPETPLPQPEPLPAAETPKPAPAANTPVPPATAPATAAPKPTIPPASTTQTAEAPKAPPVPPAPANAAPAKPEPAPKPAPKAAAPAPAPAPAKTAATPPAPKPASGPKDFNIQVAALRTEDAAAKEWNRVQNGNKALLGGLKPTYQRVTTAKGVFFRVQGGPLTQDEARKACDSLKAKGQACLVVKR